LAVSEPVLFDTSAYYIKVKIKFALEQDTKTQRGVEVQLYSFFNLGARWGGWSTPHPSHITPGNDPVRIV